jgi:hypothetical protein
VTVANYGSLVFNHWDNWSTSPARTVVLSEATVLTAYYGSPSLELINVQSTSLSGAQIHGMWTVVASGGRIVASGYTPFNFYGTPGAQYTVSVSSYGRIIFSHWDNWSTNPSRTITLAQNTWLTALYSP